MLQNVNSRSTYGLNMQIIPLMIVFLNKLNTLDITQVSGYIDPDQP